MCCRRSVNSENKQSVNVVEIVCQCKKNVAENSGIQMWKTKTKLIQDAHQYLCKDEMQSQIRRRSAKPNRKCKSRKKVSFQYGLQKRNFRAIALPSVTRLPAAPSNVLKVRSVSLPRLRQLHTTCIFLKRILPKRTNQTELNLYLDDYVAQGKKAPM
ncbi:unnamed protein product [Amoebophrya sp. A120]|nr:unnamed protein product [Amoebophrya sp. A120]|eukprot:GSA120T00015916001.1